MEDGIYLVTLVLGGVDQGAILLTLKGDTVNGGDFGFIVYGTLKSDGSNFDGKVKVEQWDPSKTSIFPGISDYYLLVSGKDTASTNGEVLLGTLESDPNKTVGLKFKKLGRAA